MTEFELKEIKRELVRLEEKIQMYTLNDDEIKYLFTLAGRLYRKANETIKK